MDEQSAVAYVDFIFAGALFRADARHLLRVIESPALLECIQPRAALKGLAFIDGRPTAVFAPPGAAGESAVAEPAALLFGREHCRSAILMDKFLGFVKEDTSAAEPEIGAMDTPSVPTPILVDVEALLLASCFEEMK